MGESQKPRKAMKQREMNPIKLVMDRGLHTVTKYRENEDGDTEEYVEAKPKGLVLAPVQTMVLAGFINEQTRRIQTLDALLTEMLKYSAEDAVEDGEGDEDQRLINAQRKNYGDDEYARSC